MGFVEGQRCGNGSRTVEFGGDAKRREYRVTRQKGGDVVKDVTLRSGSMGPKDDKGRFGVWPK